MSRILLKGAVLAIAAVLAISLISAAVCQSEGAGVLGTEIAYAGGDEPSDSENSELNKYITGLSSGYAPAGGTLSLSAEPYGIIYHIEGADPGAKLYWELWNGTSINNAKEITDSDLTYHVPSDAAGKTVCLCLTPSAGGNIRSTKVPVASVTETPDLSNYTVSLDTSVPGKATITVTNDISKDVYVEVMRGSTKIDDAMIAGWNGYSKAIDISYTGSTTLKWRLYFKETGKISTYTEWGTKTVKSAKLKKTKISVTKISNNLIGLKWNVVSGATGYKIYKGKKAVKTIKGGSKFKCKYKKKGAGKAKYKVAAIIKNSQMKKAKTGPASKAKKGAANFKKFSNSKDVSSVTYGYAPYRVQKIELKGRTYIITGYVVNNRIFKMIKYKKLKVLLYCDGKKVASKTFKNLKVNCKASKAKKLVIKVKGKPGYDLRNNTDKTYHMEWTPYWEAVGTQTFD